MIDARVKVNSAGRTVLDGPRRVTDLCAVGLFRVSRHRCEGSAPVSISQI